MTEPTLSFFPFVYQVQPGGIALALFLFIILLCGGRPAASGPLAVLATDSGLTRGYNFRSAQCVSARIGVTNDSGRVPRGRGAANPFAARKSRANHESFTR